MVEQSQVYQQVLFDFTSRYLEPLPSVYHRLAYLSTLWSEQEGFYAHQALFSVYAAASVSEVIADCHEEIFERLLEMPLHKQGEELRAYIASLPGSLQATSASCRQSCGQWIPAQAPDYLTALYLSNVNVLVELLLGDKSRVLPNN